jgi:hypothetical protein
LQDQVRLLSDFRVKCIPHRVSFERCWFCALNDCVPQLARADEREQNVSGKCLPCLMLFDFSAGHAGGYRADERGRHTKILCARLQYCKHLEARNMGNPVNRNIEDIGLRTLEASHITTETHFWSALEPTPKRVFKIVRGVKPSYAKRVCLARMKAVKQRSFGRFAPCRGHMVRDSVNGSRGSPNEGLESLSYAQTSSRSSFWGAHCDITPCQSERRRAAIIKGIIRTDLTIDRGIDLKSLI